LIDRPADMPGQQRIRLGTEGSAKRNQRLELLFNEFVISLKDFASLLYGSILREKEILLGLAVDGC
jgi:hypothetical protein